MLISSLEGHLQTLSTREEPSFPKGDTQCSKGTELEKIARP